MAGDVVLLLTVSGDIHLKSERTQKRLRRVLSTNLRDALARSAPDARMADAPRGRLLVECDDVDQRRAAAEAAVRVPGIYRAVEATRAQVDDIDDVVTLVADLNRHRVAGRSFAARVRRRGEQKWKSIDAERAIGAALFDASGGVDLSNPDVEVSAEIYDQTAYVLGETWEGFDGLPAGTQDPLLSMLSGGFDSPVASWLMMRRGCPVHFVHMMMDCSQSDHALAVAYELWRQWGAGTDPIAWVIDFEEVKEALMSQVPSRQRQVALKQLMLAAADALAARLHIPAIVTGDSVGQVSTQTIANLAEIDRAAHRTVLRPLAGMTKNEIMAMSRLAGTHDLSARAKEVCDISTGRVEVAARRKRLAAAMSTLPEDLVTRALSERKAVRLADWMPGVELIPVVTEAPDGVEACTGIKAPWQASRLVAAGTPAVIVDAPLHGRVRVAAAS